MSVVAPTGLLGPATEIAENLVWLGAIVAVLIGIRRLRPGARLPWICVVAALVLNLVGAALREKYGTWGDLTKGRELIPDLASGPAYLLLAAGMALAIRVRRKGLGGGLDAMLDGLLAGMASLTLAWIGIIQPALVNNKAGLATQLSVVAYPAISVALVVLTAQLAFAAGGRRTTAQSVAVATMVFMFVGDVLFALTDAQVLEIDKTWVMAPYALQFSGIVFFALHPTFAEFGERMPPHRVVASPSRLAIVALALTTPAVVSVFPHETTTGTKWVLGGIILALTGIATLRVIRALQTHARSETALLYQATHDVLTGALNRAGLLDELTDLRTQDVPHAVLFLDMDRFKLVNDTFGHTFGDELLVAVAQRLQQRRRLGDVVARIGGDEFVLVIDASRGLDDTVAAAEELRRLFLSPFQIDGTEIPVSLSIGVVTSASGAGPEDLLRDADTAMYGAKDAGRDSIMVFDSSMRDRVANRLGLERDLRHAQQRGELAAHFQPVVDLESGSAVGFEALMRWNHPTRGTVPPLDFIPIAEETGIIIEIGAWILEESCRQLSEWRRTLEGASDFWMSINVSIRQLRDPDFVQFVEQVLDRYQLPPESITLEVTESMLIDEGVTMPLVLKRVREIGVRLSIDDFGTGYSSLAYVQRYPFNCVKIDRAFVELLDDEESGEQQLVGAIVAMATALDLSTIAEGVETNAQADRLVELGCTRAQGFYFSRPVTADLIPDTVRRLAGVRRPFATAG